MSGLKLCGAGEWLLEKHGTGADTGRIVTAALTTNNVDDRLQIDLLLDQVTASVATFIADGTYDQEGVAATVAEHHPEAAIIVPPR
jgi:DDE family transposase